MSFQPDDFPEDPYGAGTSQAGHAAIIGMSACLLLLQPITNNLEAASV